MMIVKSLVVIASRGPGSRPDANKDPPSACCVRARNIRGSESRMFDRWQLTMGVVSGEKIFLPFKDKSKIAETKDPAL